MEILYHYGPEKDIPSTFSVINLFFQLLAIAPDLCRSHDLPHNDRWHLRQPVDRGGPAEMSQSAQCGRRLYHQVSLVLASPKEPANLLAAAATLASVLPICSSAPWFCPSRVSASSREPGATARYCAA